MKKTFLFSVLITGVFLLSACQNFLNTPTTPSNNTKTLEEVSVTEEPATSTDISTEISEVTDTMPVPLSETTLEYTGNWFTVNYPDNFVSSPNGPMVFEDDYEYIETDEAFFLSPDEKVEFFVYSPQWGGDPESYLTPTSGEEVISDETEEEKLKEDPEMIGDKKIRTLKLKATDDTYFRTVISIKEQLSTGSETHKVFGIKYDNTTTYDLYQPLFEKFMSSLQQFAD